jgi:predicted LPLAT superfamily acyltransferase
VSAPRGWLGTRERGSVFLMRLLVLVSRGLGRAGLRALLRPISLYYALLDREVGRASRGYLARVLPSPGFRDVYAHVLRFAQCAADRYFLLSGRTAGLRFVRTGSQLLRDASARKQGGLLIGAHLGSFEALRASASDEQLDVRVLVHFDNARKITALLREAAPDFLGSLIEITPGDVSYVLKVREAVRAGALVAVLADRTGLSDRSERASFLGEMASFPVGPFMLAGMLRCPVFLTFGLYEEPNVYRLFCEPFLAADDLPRGRPTGAWVQAQIERFAQRLEHYCRLAPYNWFNFFDFWAEPAPVPEPSARPAAEPEDLPMRMPHAAAWCLVLGAALSAHRCCSPSNAFAEPPAKKPSPAPAPLTAESLLARFARSPGLFARFREEKRLALLEDPLVSEGTLHFARPGRLARHTLKPARSSVLIENGKLRYGDGAGSHAIDLRSNPTLRVFVESLLRLLEGDLAAIRAVYSVEFTLQGPAEREGWRLVLRPKGEPLSKLIERMTLTGAGLVVGEMRVVEAGGDEATTTFSDVDVGRKYSDAEIAEIFRLPGK